MLERRCAQGDLRGPAAPRSDTYSGRITMPVITSGARKLVATAATSALILAGAAVAAAPAGAATAKPTVTIGKIASVSVVEGATATIKPVVKTKGNVKVTSKTVTVTKDGKTVAKNKKSAKLGAGTYTVTTTVKYKTATTKRTNKKVKVALEDGMAPMMCKTSKVKKIKKFEMITHMADVACTDPKSKGTVRYSDVYFGYNKQDRAWYGADARGNAIAFEDLHRTKSQESYVIPVGTLKVSVKTTKKVWSKVKTKKSTQTLTITTK